MNAKRLPEAVYLPSNEPYLGRRSVYHFDQVVMSCLEHNDKVAAFTHGRVLTELQMAASQIIPQGINLALTIREMVRQGYLFGALVLMRPLIERAAIISYLYKHPKALESWRAGWQYRKRPSFTRMLAAMDDKADIEVARQVCDLFSNVVHGNPAASDWNLVQLDQGGLGYSVGKIIDNPDLCDFICYQTCCYLVVIIGMMAACFPDPAQSAKVP